MDSASLDLDRGYGVGEETFERIAERIRSQGARSIVEFGSGVSSIRLALEFPEAQILSIESNREWYDRISRMRAAKGVESNLTLSYRPLRWQFHAGAVFLSYQRGPFPESLDAVLIDGPPTWTRRGREACLYQILPHLIVGGRIFLDDYSRNREKAIVRNWMLSYPETFAAVTLDIGHGVCILEKKAEAIRPRVTMSSFADHAIEFLGVMLTHPWRR